MEILFKISYHHGTATEGLLEMSDAAVSLQGFGRALTIAAHALINDGELRKRGNIIGGAKLYLRPARKGSFEQLVVLAIENPDMIALGMGVTSNAFWDMIKWTWGKVLNIAHHPETDLVKRIAKRIEPRIGELEEILEIPLQQAQRPIRSQSEIEISLKRSAANEVMRLNAGTLQAVLDNTETELIDLVGNVTRYNIISGNGRFFDDEEGRTIPFSTSFGMRKKAKARLTWSLAKAGEGEYAKIKCRVALVKSSRGVLRKYIIHDAFTLKQLGGAL